MMGGAYRTPDPLAKAMAELAYEKQISAHLVRSVEIEQNGAKRARLALAKEEAKNAALRADYSKLASRQRSSRVNKWLRENGTIALGVLVIAATVIAGFVHFSSDRAAHRMESGTVVSRDHHHAYTTTSCHKVGETTVCTPVHHAERWSVTMADGYHRERVVDLREADWHEHAPGSYVCMTPENCVPPHDDDR